MSSLSTLNMLGYMFRFIIVKDSSIFLEWHANKNNIFPLRKHRHTNINWISVRLMMNLRKKRRRKNRKYLSLWPDFPQYTHYQVCKWSKCQCYNERSFFILKITSKQFRWHMCFIHYQRLIVNLKHWTGDKIYSTDQSDLPVQKHCSINYSLTENAKCYLERSW